MSQIQGMMISEFTDRFEIGMVKIDDYTIVEMITCLKDIPYTEDLIEERDNLQQEFDELKIKSEEFESKMQQLELQLELIQKHFDEKYDDEKFAEQVGNILYPPAKPVATSKPTKRRRL